MSLQIPIEQLQESVLKFLQDELGDAWDNVPEEQRELIVRVAINYGKENLKLIASELFQGINVEETKANIQQIQAQLLALGVALQAQVMKALNQAVIHALQALLGQMTATNLPK